MARLLEDRVAIVTGAGQGIGQVIAETLAEHGAHVVPVDVQLEKVQAVAEGIRANGDRAAMALHVDVALKASVDAMLQAVLERFGRVDILVNNAGIMRPKSILDLEEADWDAVYAVNVKGTFLCSQAAARAMVSRRSGCIINVSSASSKKADPKGAAYNSSKSAVNGLTRMLALELGEYGIRANGICPGATESQMLDKVCSTVPGLRQELLSRTPLKRFATARDQANVVVFLASDLARHVTGESILVAGGELMGQ
jgi:NAD(P)-dependent dehydrogenase (short-subunit alcohol dehydrogenase family)